ncbi:hypothetical protein BDF19DRAFT_445262 [Syncephalis fuscata]|nr:hypothetical protein BDF19DRAFT_445262 [Syncephalis fuscata]
MQKIEQLAEELLLEKHLLVDYDRRRNDNRVALNRMQESKDKKVWLNLGDLFVRLPKRNATDMINKKLEGGDGRRTGSYNLNPVSAP